MRIPGEDTRRPTVAPRRRLRLPPEIQAYEEILERNKEKAKQLSGMLDLVRARVEWMAQYGWRMAGESQGGTAGGLRGLPYGSMPGGLPSGVSFGARFLTDSMGPLGSWVAQQMLEARAGGRSLGTGKARWPQGLMEWHQGEGGERAGLGFLGNMMDWWRFTPGQQKTSTAYAGLRGSGTPSTERWSSEARLLVRAIRDLRRELEKLAGDRIEQAVRKIGKGIVDMAESIGEAVITSLEPAEEMFGRMMRAAQRAASGLGTVLRGMADLSATLTQGVGAMERQLVEFVSFLNELPGRASAAMSQVRQILTSLMHGGQAQWLGLLHNTQTGRANQVLGRRGGGYSGVSMAPSGRRGLSSGTYQGSAPGETALASTLEGLRREVAETRMASAVQPAVYLDGRRLSMGMDMDRRRRTWEVSRA